MDINYLYLRQQVSMMRADQAACVCSRAAHLGLANLYLEKIASNRGKSLPNPMAFGAVRRAWRFEEYLPMHSQPSLMKD